MKTRLITLDVPEGLLARIETLAHARRVSVGQLLRDELSRHLGAADDDEVIDRSDVAPRRASAR